MFRFQRRTILRDITFVVSLWMTLTKWCHIAGMILATTGSLGAVIVQSLILQLLLLQLLLLQILKATI